MFVRRGLGGDFVPERGNGFGNGRVENVMRRGQGNGVGFRERIPAWSRSFTALSISNHQW
jgi:hypothetical protein